MNKQNLIDALQAHFVSVCGDSGPTSIYADEAVHFLIPKIDHLHSEITKAQKEIKAYRRTLVQIEAKGLGATATAGYICSNIAETALKQGDNT